MNKMKKIPEEIANNIGIGNHSAHSPEMNNPKGSVNFISIEDVPATRPNRLFGVNSCLIVKQTMFDTVAENVRIASAMPIAHHVGARIRNPKAATSSNRQ